MRFPSRNTNIREYARNENTQHTHSIECTSSVAAAAAYACGTFAIIVCCPALQCGEHCNTMREQSKLTWAEWMMLLLMTDLPSPDAFHPEHL